MLTLSGRIIELRDFPDDAARRVVRVTDRKDRLAPLRSREAFLARDCDIPEGFGTYLALAQNASVLDRLPAGTRAAVLPDTYDYLSDGDLLRLWPGKKELRTIYRRNALHSSFLLTERCNHYCLMCSQPPKDIDDGWIIDDVLAALPLIDRSTRAITFTGGEPTLLGDDFLRILRAAKSYLPETAIHILSNGRRFIDTEFVRKYADIRHPDIMVGIPLYSDLSTAHDHVVQADGAFDETIRGILNLKRHGQRVEIRVVVHRLTYERLPQLAEFIGRNLTFVDQVVFMGLEITGFTRANLDALWIDPVDYQRELYDAVTCLDDHRMRVSIYNHQLCTLDKRLWPFAKKSISDWKNEYMSACAGCLEQERCGGFFSSSAIRHSDYIRPFL